MSILATSINLPIFRSRLSSLPAFITSGAATKKDMSTFSLPLAKGVNAEGRQRTLWEGSLMHWVALFLLVKGVEETEKVLEKVLKVVPLLCRLSQEGKGVSIVRKMKKMIKGYVSGLILYIGKSGIREFAHEAEISHTKPIRKNRGWLKVCLMLLLLFTTEPRIVRGNQLIPGGPAMNSLLASKNLRGLALSERRWMLGKEAASMNDHINYQNLNFPPTKSSPNKGSKKANSYRRGCNPAEYCRGGKKGKN